jgi:amino acid adenylation domain-containing protein
VARFEQQVAMGPSRVAIQTGPQVLTYERLNCKASRLARAILAQGAGGNVPVALLLPHGAPVITALLATLKAGKIYVPLDPTYPPARLSAMLRDAQAQLLVTDTTHLPLATSLVPSRVPVLNIEAIETVYEETNLGLPLAAEALAYILYTSGSTGDPKGVVQNHRNVLHNIMKYTNGTHLCADDRLSLLLSFSFSGAVTNTFSALLNGAALFPFHVRELGVADLATYLQRDNITVYQSVASTFRHFLDTLTGTEQFPALRLIDVFGETVTRQDVEGYKRHFAPHCLLHNRLASTEMSVMRHYFLHTDTPLTGSVVPVGYAVDDTEVLILDDDGNDMGNNRVGEIAVKSPYLAVGYWRQPELTQTAFRPDPAGSAARLYRTGDLGLLRPDGCLEHHGRNDFRVKIRGHRIEVGEVETALLELTTVKAAVVVAREDRPGDAYLAAYLLPATRPVPTVASLRQTLAVTLPDYMLPSIFVWLEAFPLTPNGKVDRQALPAPDQVRCLAETATVAPRTPVEEAVAHLWAEVLMLEQVSIYDHFFDLGGHSLLAMQLLVRVRERLRVDVPLRTFFAEPTVAAMAETIVQQHLQGVTPTEVAGWLAEVETRCEPAGEDA